MMFGAGQSQVSRSFDASLADAESFTNTAFMTFYDPKKIVSLIRMDKPAINMWDVSTRPYPPDALAAGDLRAALDGFATREMLDYGQYGRSHSDIWICGFGVTLWLMGDAAGAAKFWLKACDEAYIGKFKYSSTGTFQPGLLLWFASVWLKNQDWREEADTLFDKLLKKRQPVMGAGFSILLAKFLRREIDLSQVQAGYGNQPTQAQRSYKLQLLFYAGVRAYGDGDIAETRRLWAQVGDGECNTLLFEYYLLKHERNKLGS